jgi:predicted O-methyltransferase YrrM
MIEKARTVAWFAARPAFWPHAVALGARRLSPGRDRPEDREEATAWAAARAVSKPEALRALGMAIPDTGLPTMPAPMLEAARARAEQSAVRMGGPGDLDLLFAAVRLSGARRVLETGVAYGWSSLAILAALQETPDARLVSVDMPYPKMGNEAFVGIVVPEDWRDGWTLVREPDRHGLDRALRLLGGRIDLAHYDSDKSWHGRRWAMPRLWAALRPGGLLLCDDIQDNPAFAAFVAETGTPFAVCESGGKFVGLTRKPAA